LSLIYFGPPFSGPAFSVNPRMTVRICARCRAAVKHSARHFAYLRALPLANHVHFSANCDSHVCFACALHDQTQTTSEWNLPT